MPAASNSISRHPSSLPPVLPTITPPPLFISPSFGLLCFHGYAQPEPSCCGETCQGAALRSPDVGRLHWRPLSHGVIVQFGFDKVCAPSRAAAEKCSRLISLPNVELVQFYRPGGLERTPLNSRKKHKNISPIPFSYL